MLERSQLRVLRTILGLPARASAAGIHLLLGTIPIRYISQIKLLTFVRSTIGLPESVIARRLLILRVNQSSPSGSITHAIAATLELYCLPDIPSLVAELPSKLAWKAQELLRWRV